MVAGRQARLATSLVRDCRRTIKYSKLSEVTMNSRHTLGMIIVSMFDIAELYIFFFRLSREFCIENDHSHIASILQEVKPSHYGGSLSLTFFHSDPVCASGCGVSHSHTEKCCHREETM